VAEPVKRQIRWGRIAMIAGALFVLAMGSLTVAELISGRSAASWTGNGNGSTTTFSGVVKSNEKKTTPTPATSPTDKAPADQATEPATEPTPGATTDPGTEPTADPQDTSAPLDNQQPTGTGDTQQQDPDQGGNQTGSDGSGGGATDQSTGSGSGGTE
jgi:hypothetical protein